ncbi:MAG: hypothetical protein K9G76_07080 [Bacteroidales bacterium]|nr:hypothetical protein [Bacteroidales bacterium]MCF8404549.1 hypothetical protein [Bacteroidales bacterium]
MSKAWLFIIFLLFLGVVSCNQNKKKQSPLVEHADWRYFGQGSPGKIAKLFSPEIISTPANERDFTISPSGNELFYSMVFPGNSLSTIIYLYHDGAFWSQPLVAPFSGAYPDLEPMFSPDGKKLFFVSKRPLNKKDTTDDWNIWFVERIQTGWSEPIALDTIINSENDEYYPSVTLNGTLYFTSKRKDSRGAEDLYFARFKHGTYFSPVNLGDAINSEYFEFNSFIAPDESFLIFSSFGREDGFGGGDLYISHKTNDTTWTKAKNMGREINSDKLDYCPFVTSDKRFLFFTSQRIDPQISDKQVKNHQTIIKLLQGIENGNGNIYWVNFQE